MMNTIRKHPEFWVCAAGILLLNLYMFNTVGFPAMDLAGGPDSYLRAVMVHQFLETGSWADSAITRINPPEGHVLHWSRAQDILILIGALPLSWGVPSGQAIWLWSLALPTLLFLASLAALIWASAPLCDARSRAVLALLLALQVSIRQHYLPTNIDHHGLLLLLTILILGSGIHILCQRTSRTQNLMLGGIAGLAIWAGVETLIPLFACVLTFGLVWLFRGTGREAAFHYAAGALLGGIVALLIERGTGPAALFSNEVDRFSGFHLALFLCHAVFWFVACRIAPNGSRSPALASRALLGIAGAGLLALVCLALQPQILAGKVHAVDPLYWKTRSIHISESQSIFALDPGQSPLVALGNALRYIPFVLPGLALAVVMAIRSRDGTRHAWTIMIVLCGLMLRDGDILYRFTPYLVLATIVPAALLVSWMANRLEARFTPPSSTARFMILASFLSLLPIMAMSPLQRMAAPAENSRIRAGTCDIGPAITALNDPAIGGRPSIVLAFADNGPEIMWRTHHSVLSVPNHRLQPGYTLTHEIMTSPTDSRAQDLLRAGKVSFIVLCNRHPGLWFDHAGGTTFASRLAGGNTSAGIRELALEGVGENPVHLYRVEEPDRGSARP